MIKNEPKTIVEIKKEGLIVQGEDNGRTNEEKA